MYATYAQLAETQAAQDVITDEDDAVGNVASFIKSCTPQFSEAMKSFGLDAGEEGVTWDPAKLNRIEELANQVMDEYDSEGSGKVWEQYDLSGDDDVDYNGGYILMFIDCLKEFAIENSR